ncbi:hypothetical protein ACWOFO_16290 [Carnobacterium maltaromaticum]
MPDYYRDPTHIDIENWVDMDKVDEIHKQLARWLREKMYGLDVREALARLVEQTSSDLFDANQVALALEQLAISLEEKWNEEYQSLTDEWKNTLAGVTVDDEVINARIDLRGFVYKTLKERLDAMQAVSDKLNPVSEVFSIEHNQFSYPTVRVLSLEYGLGVVPLESEPVFGGSSTVTINCDVEYVDRNNLKVKVPLAFAMTNPTTERISANEYLLVEGVKSLIIEVGTKAEANVETFVTREILSDFNTPPKIAGSNVENGNKILGHNAATVQLPSAFTSEASQAGYDLVKLLDGKTYDARYTVSTRIAQQLILFDALWILEENFPQIFKNATTTAEKVAIAKNLIKKFQYKVWAKASGPTGTLCTHSMFNPISALWVATVTSTGNNILERGIGSANTSTPAYLNPDGNYYFASYAEASNGIVASSVSIDYTNITITARVPFSKI